MGLSETRGIILIETEFRQDHEQGAHSSNLTAVDLCILILETLLSLLLPVPEKQSK